MQGVRKLAEVRVEDRVYWDSVELIRRAYGCEKDCNKDTYGGFINSYAMFPKNLNKRRRDGKKDNFIVPDVLMSVRADSPEQLIDIIPERRSVYLGRNPSMRRGGHSLKGLYSYRVVVVDCDAHQIPVSEANELARKAANTLTQEVNEGNFDGMEPIGINMTGRGVQILWSLNPLNAKFLDNQITYKKLSDALCQWMDAWLEKHPEFSALSVDRPVSKNAASLIRMPGSNNQMVLFELGEEKSHVEPHLPDKCVRHNGKSLLKTVVNHPYLCPAKVDRQEQEEHSTYEKAKNTHVDLSNIENIKKEDGFEVPKTCSLSWEKFSLRFNSFLKAVKKTYPQGIEKGTRDYCMFVLYNLALKCMTKAKAESIIIQLNQRLCAEPLPDNLLLSYMSASNKQRNADGTTGYMMSNAYIRNVTGVTKHFTSVDFKESNKIRNAERAKRKQQKAKDKKTAYRMRKHGETLQIIADRLKRTARTIFNWCKEMEKELAAKQEMKKKLINMAKNLKADKEEKNNQFSAFFAKAVEHSSNAYDQPEHSDAKYSNLFPKLPNKGFAHCAVEIVNPPLDLACPA